MGPTPSVRIMYIMLNRISSNDILVWDPINRSFHTPLLTFALSD